jgi:hypothetical protein
MERIFTIRPKQKFDPVRLIIHTLIQLLVIMKMKLSIEEKIIIK